jgi:hypothetical protein
MLISKDPVDPDLVDFSYAVGTGKAPDGKQFPILRSRNFTDWEVVGGAMDGNQPHLLRRLTRPRAPRPNNVMADGSGTTPVVPTVIGAPVFS